MKTFAEAEQRLRESLPSYEERRQQQQLAAAIEQHMAAHANRVPSDPPPDHLLGQGPCGVGKAFAYLIPAILSGRRVIVSVTTKALQSQLQEKDLPFLQQHLGIPFTWSVLKGRSNYFCRLAAMSAEPAEVPSLAALLRASEDPTWDGTRDTLPFGVSAGEWARVASDTETCRDNGCQAVFQTGDVGCYAEMARARARTSRIVVVNHALLCAELSLRASMGGTGMLDEYHHVVVDEAHELEDQASGSLGAKITEGSFTRLGVEMRNWVVRYDEAADEKLAPAVMEMAAASRALFEALVPDLSRSKEKTFRIRQKTLNDHASEFTRVFDALVLLQGVWSVTSLDKVSDDSFRRAKQRRDQIRSRLAGLFERYGEVVAARQDEVVRWVEVEDTARGERRRVLRSAPVSVAPFLRKNLFDQTPATLVSATLAVRGDFRYIAGRLGIDRYRPQIVDSPFDFRSQARLYVPTHLPEPSQQYAAAWEEQTVEEISRLITASRGRALVLFASNAHLRKVAADLRGRIGHTLLVQGEGSVQELTERFRTDTSSILLGSRSFMTGFDVQGEALSLVIIAKMPFPVPTDPMVEARCDVIKARGGNDFGEYTIPHMSLVLQQAAGRLIRHRDDTGVVAVLDKRLVTKGYGTQIIRDLPPMPRVHNIGDLEAFLAAN